MLMHSLQRVFLYLEEPLNHLVISSIDGRYQFMTGLQKTTEILALLMVGSSLSRFSRFADGILNTKYGMKLFESIREIRKCKEAMRITDKPLRTVTLINSVAWSAYWIFENLGFLCKIKVL